MSTTDGLPHPLQILNAIIATYALLIGDHRIILLIFMIFQKSFGANLIGFQCLLFLHWFMSISIKGYQQAEIVIFELLNFGVSMTLPDFHEVFTITMTSQ